MDLTPDMLRQMAPVGRNVAIVLRGARRPYNVTVVDYTAKSMIAGRHPDLLDIPFADIVHVY